MNCMAQVATQLQIEEVAHSENLEPAGSPVEGKTVVVEIADSVKIVVDWGHIEELGVSIRVVEDKAAGKLP